MRKVSESGIFQNFRIVKSLMHGTQSDKSLNQKCSTTRRGGGLMQTLMEKKKAIVLLKNEFENLEKRSQRSFWNFSLKTDWFTVHVLFVY